MFVVRENAKSKEKIRKSKFNDKGLLFRYWNISSAYSQRITRTVD